MRNGSLTEYKQIIRFCNRVFHKSFARILPKLYKNHPQFALNHIIDDKDGEYRGTLATIKTPLILGERNLVGYGIGMVSVAKKYRKQGVMSAMLNHAITNTKDADFMFLSGLRQRYQHFGFVPSGDTTRFLFIKNNFPTSDSTITFCRLTAKSPYLNALWTIYTSQKEGFYRDKDRFYDILTSWGRRVTVVLQGGVPVGALAHKIGGYFIVDIFTSIDINAVIAAYIAKKHKYGLSVKLDSYHQKELSALYNSAERYTISTSANVRICNFTNVINVLLNYKANYTSMQNGTLNLGIEDTNYHIVVENNIANVSVSSDKSEITLSRIDATVALFTSVTSVLNAPPLFYAWFPLPFSIAEQDNV